MHDRLFRCALIVMALVVGGCGDDDATGLEFDSSLGVDLGAMTQRASGLYVQDVTIGTGSAAASGNAVTVRYSGWLVSGFRFDAGTYTFRLGRREAIDGFDEGVTGMRVGGKRRIVIPPALGYGNQAVGQIPPNSYLLFDLELLLVAP
jgi:FKBP-type peptidyl-prolyl cis-trans isomerase FkpA